MKYRYAENDFDGIVCGCPNCGQAVKVHDNDLGQNLRCFHCKEVFRAPSLNYRERRTALLLSRPQNLVIGLSLYALSALIYFVDPARTPVLPRNASPEAVLIGLLLFVLFFGGIVVALILFCLRGHNWARIVVIAIQAVYAIDDMIAVALVNDRARFAFVLLRAGSVYLLLTPQVRSWFTNLKRLKKERHLGLSNPIRG